MNNKTPKSNRLHIAILGRINTGKSSLINMIIGQYTSITSDIAGTTTDVVEKTMELLPIGPVVFLDTAGINDNSLLSKLRFQKTVEALNKADIVFLVVEPNIWTKYEDEILIETQIRKIPILIIINKIDTILTNIENITFLKTKSQFVIAISSLSVELEREKYLSIIKNTLLKMIPEDFLTIPSLVSGLLKNGELAILVIPIDLQAPKGRLILPQVQTIRDLLDIDAVILILKEKELSYFISQNNIKPNIVICDSQVISKVCADININIPLTTFSILFARQKSDLITLIKGVFEIENLKINDNILIAEACTHHALVDDIGRVKIPRLIQQFTGNKVNIDIISGKNFPQNLKKYNLIIHCGGCMLSRKQMLNRLQEAKKLNIPITNYGIVISFLQGILHRVLAPFPAALLLFNNLMKKF